MSDQENYPVPVRGNVEFRADRTMEAVVLSEFRAKFIGEKREAKSLDGVSFTILEARQFPTAYEEQGENPFFVIAVDENGEKFNTVLGGKAVVDDLIVWSQMGGGAPLAVTLRYNAGKGQYAGYYTFE